MRANNEKRCGVCGKLGVFSLVCVLSSLGVSPRAQEYTTALLLCDECLRGCCSATDAAGVKLLQDKLRAAYVELSITLDMQADERDLPSAATSQPSPSTNSKQD